MKLQLFTGLALLASATLGAAQTRVLVVDALGGPGAQYASVNAAVLAATDGDIVLVRPGNYDEIVVIEDKTLTLLGAEGPARPGIRGLHVRNTAASTDVTVRGLSARTDSSSSVLIEGCEGKVWLEDLRVDLAPSATYTHGTRIVDSAAVVLTRCTVARPLGWYIPGLSVVRSTVQVFHSSLAGCDSNDELFSHGSEGGAALWAEDSRVLVAGGTLVGGAGGSILSPICALRGGNGGTALRVMGTSRVELQGCTLAGGPGGTSCGLDGQPGAPLIVEGGRVDESPGPARECRLESLAQMGRSTPAVLVGQPGELALLLCSPRSAVASPAALFRGRLLLDDPLRIPFVAFVPASGELSLRLEVPRFLGSDSLRLHAQGLFLDPDTGFVLSNPSSSIVLGAHQLPAGPP